MTPELLLTALPVLTSVRPDLALQLVRTTIKHTPLGRLFITPLVRQHPQEMAGLVLAADEAVTSVSFGAVAHKLEMETLLALVERHVISITPYKFDKFTPEPLRDLPLPRSRAHPARAPTPTDAIGAAGRALDGRSRRLRHLYRQRCRLDR